MAPECVTCGKEIGAEMLFCPYCGTRQPQPERKRVTEGPIHLLGSLPGLMLNSEVWTFIVILQTEDELILVPAERPTRSISVLKLYQYDDENVEGEFTEKDWRRARGYLEREEELKLDDKGILSVALQTVTKARLSSGGENEYRIDIDTAAGSYHLRCPVDHALRDRLREKLGQRMSW